MERERDKKDSNMKSRRYSLEVNKSMALKGLSHPFLDLRKKRGNISPHQLDINLLEGLPIALTKVRFEQSLFIC